MKRRYRIETVTYVEVETTGRWTHEQIVAELKVQPCVSGGAFHFSGARNGSVRTISASLVESFVAEVAA